MNVKGRRGRRSCALGRYDLSTVKMRGMTLSKHWLDGTWYVTRCNAKVVQLLLAHEFIYMDELDEVFSSLRVER